MAQANNEFQSPYKFQADGKVVVIEHHLEKRIRSDADGPGVDGDGGFGKRAQWKVHLKRENGEVVIKLQNEKTGDYLRIMKNGEKVNAGGKGQGLCDFKVHKMSSRVVKLESVAVPGAYIAVSKDGVIVGKGGPRCRLEFFKEGGAESFTKPYRFAKENTVVIEHRDDKNVRVTPGNTTEVDTDGGFGEFAQWTAIPSEDGKVVQFKSKKTEGYLRIKNNGEVDADGKGKGLTFFKVHRVDAINEVRLESQKNDGVFLEFKPKDKKLVGGDNKNRKSIFSIFREN